MLTLATAFLVSSVVLLLAIGLETSFRLEDRHS
jgi:hypothetical protein